MVGIISAGLIGLATSGLNNRSTLQQLRNREYAADGAIEQAISQVRLLTCSGAATGFVVDTLNAVAIRVDWVNACGVIQSGNRGATGASAASDGVVVAQRNVIFAACANTGAACATTDVIVRAEVNFQQAATGVVTQTFVQSWSVNR